MIFQTLDDKAQCVKVMGFSKMLTCQRFYKVRRSRVWSCGRLGSGVVAMFCVVLSYFESGCGDLAFLCEMGDVDISYL